MREYGASRPVLFSASLVSAGNGLTVRGGVFRVPCSPVQRLPHNLNPVLCSVSSAVFFNAAAACTVLSVLLFVNLFFVMNYTKRQML